MDLPTCPSCGQSVLDDDAEYCPFCGASMTGGAPAKSPPATTAKPAEAKPAAQSKPAKGQDDDGGEDDPFQVDSSIHQRAVRAIPKPRAGRAHRVVCPMCETPGFIPAKAAGRDVKCANTECLVPVFTSPPIETEEEEEAPPPKKKSAALPILLVLVLAGGGGAVWHFVLRDQGTQEPDNSNPAVTGNGTSPQDGGASGQTDPQNDNDDPGTTEPEVPAGPSLAEIQSSVLAHMVESSRLAGQLRKPYCRRLTAGAYVAARDADGARAQLKQLAVVGRQFPYYRVDPLVSLAWQARAENDQAIFQECVKQAFEASGELPTTGRESIDVATRLAAALVANGQFEDAEKLIQRHQTVDPRGQVSHVVSAAIGRRTFDLSGEAEQKSVLPLQAPQWAAVTRLLCLRGLWDEATDWAGQPADPMAHIESVAVWASERLLASSDEDSEALHSSVIAVCNSLPPVGKVFAFAQIAYRVRDVDSQFAAKMCQSAVDAAKTLPMTKAITLPNLGMEKCYAATLEAKANTSSELRMTIAALTETARASAAVNGPESAVPFVRQALEHCRALAPTIAQTSSRLVEIDNRGISDMRAHLKKVMQLATNDRARVIANTYRRVCRQLHIAATGRLELETRLVIRACDWMPLKSAWTLVEEAASQTDLNLQVNYLATAVPEVIAGRFEQTGMAADAAAVQSKTPQRPQGFSSEHIQDQLLREAAESKEWDRGLEIAMTFGNEENQLLRIQALIPRVMADGGIAQTAKWLQGVPGGLVREESLQWSAALAAKQGQYNDVWNLIKDSTLGPTEAVFACHGLMVGIAAYDDSKAAEADPTSESD